MKIQTTISKTILAPIRSDEVQESLTRLGVEHVKSIEVFSSLSSTNDLLLQNQYLKRNEIVVCISEEQTQGRGRIGHQWCSPKGVNLYLSILWPLDQWRQQYETLGLLLLTSIAQMLEQLEFNQIQLKWPNDICMRGKKLGGILIERKKYQSTHNLIIGIGLNVAMSTLKNTSLETPWIDLISSKPEWSMSRNVLAADVISSISQVLCKLDNDGQNNLPAIWHRYDLLYGRKIEFSYNDNRILGTALGIDTQGQMIVELEGKKLHLHSSHVNDITL